MKLRGLFVHDSEPRPRSQVEARVARIPTRDLQGWADQCIYEVGRSLSEYSKDPTYRALLDQAVEGTEILLRVLEEMQRRP